MGGNQWDVQSDPRTTRPFSFGHACVLVETKGLSLLFDPALSYTYNNEVPLYTYEGLPDSIDYVLLTHNHRDHVLFETLLQIRSKVRNIIVLRNSTGSLQDPSMKLLLQSCEFKNIIELSDMESISIRPCEIIGLPLLGEHADLDVKTKRAYMVKIGGRSILFCRRFLHHKA